MPTSFFQIALDPAPPAEARGQLAIALRDDTDLQVTPIDVAGSGCAVSPPATMNTYVVSLFTTTRTDLSIPVAPPSSIPWPPRAAAATRSPPRRTSSVPN